MPIAYTSRLALREITAQLGPLQRRVWETIRDWPHRDIGPCIRDLAEKLDLETATVSGRISELREAGAIADGPIKLSTTGKRVKTYHAVAWRAPGTHENPQMTLL